MFKRIAKRFFEASEVTEPVSEAIRLEAKIIEQEHRYFLIWKNFIFRGQWEKGDVRRNAAKVALAFSFFTPVVGIAGIISIMTAVTLVWQSMLLSRQTVTSERQLEESKNQLAAIKDQNSLIRSQNEDFLEARYRQRITEIYMFLYDFKQPSGIDNKVPFYNHRIRSEAVKELIKLQAGRGKVDLSEALLQDVDLRGVDLSGVVFREADLSSARLAGANLSEAYLRNSNLSGATLFEAKLINARLDNVDFTGAHLQDVDFSNSRLLNAKLISVDISGAVFDDCDMTSADFEQLYVLSSESARPSFSGALLVAYRNPPYKFIEYAEQAGAEVRRFPAEEFSDGSYSVEERDTVFAEWAEGSGEP